MAQKTTLTSYALPGQVYSFSAKTEAAAEIAVALALKDRGVALTLESRDLALALKDRSVALTLESRE